MTKRAPFLLVVGAALFVSAVIVWLVSQPHPVVKTQTTVIESPVTTPLPRDSGPRNNRRSKATTRRSGPSLGEGPTTPRRGHLQDGTTGVQNRPLPPRKRQTSKTKRKHRPSPQRPKQPGQPSNPPPPSHPPADVTVPAPLTVCIRPVGGVNC